MGQINHPVKLEQMLKNFGIKNFVETGTGDGSSMDKVLLTEIVDNAYGIELDDELYANLAEAYAGIDYMHLYKGYSEDKMANVMDDIDDEPALFWLDAHFPGADYGPAGYGAEEDVNKRLPMEAELRVMKEKRDLSKDIIFMDDLRIYVDRGYEAGNWDQRKMYGGDGYDFVEELIGDTHVLVEHHGDQGYLLAFPVDTDQEKIMEIVKQ
jgi:hypothetical protein|tara:strand:- start:213 stop:842 length:630 start_codon:yes stop_codon:yes gene_type:complete